MIDGGDPAKLLRLVRCGAQIMVGKVNGRGVAPVHSNGRALLAGC
jgi:hypothetical protein